MHPAFVQTRANDWGNKGNILAAQDKYDDAIKTYEKAIELAPNNADTWNNSAEALKALGRTAESNAAFVKAK